ncbi:MAG: hypothetical protein K6B41_09895 [Butyrivibrio sp.]|nr:hypothetical protein [Butyrivibrio sp.]
MRKGKLGKGLFVIIFFICMLIYSAFSFRQTWPKVEEYFEEKDGFNIDTLKDDIGSIEGFITENCYARYDCIEIYGTLSRLIGKTEINSFEYAKDDYGGYSLLNFSDQVDNMDYKLVAERVLAFKNDANKHGAKFMYLQSPNKIDENWNPGSKDVPYDIKNEKTDKLIGWMQRFGIDVFDFRETLKNSGMTYQEMFYNTDHHWTGVAAFRAFQDLVKHFKEKYDEDLDPDGYYTNLDNYDVSYWDHVYLGSAGRNVGFSFGDANDYMQLVVPKFEGKISWLGYVGDYKDTVLRYNKLDSENPYLSDSYGFYLYGVAKKDSITNHANPDGLKILFVRDSFMSPVIIDMIPFCSQIDCYWGLYVDDAELKEKVATGNYDYVILSYGTLNMDQSSFNFYTEQ